eukprot:NODE_313_length_10011_cov_0.634584.p4 type:complete len:308 gc:universal NODE_313_length_10011_cov_0.634584:6477-7400(+)
MDPKFQCRYYRNKYPNVDDLVIVTTNQIAEMGAYCSLLEYNNVEGMILLSELSRRRIRSIQKVIRVGKDEVCVVLKVDQEKGYIDLSKKKVTLEDSKMAEERYLKARTVHSLMKHVAEKTDRNLEELYEMFCWDLYDKYGHALDAFKIAVTDSEKVFEGIKIDPQVFAELQVQIKRRLTPQPIKVRVDVNAFCYAYEGIDAIKEIFGDALKNEHQGFSSPLKIKLVAPPVYVITALTLDKNAGVELMTKIVDDMKEKLKSKGGDLTIKEAVRAVSTNDDLELEKMMKKLALENAEVSGDDEISGDDE